MAELTQATAREYLQYNELTGELTWIKASSNRTKVGSKAGSTVLTGYTQIKLLGELYQAHRLIWFMVHGVWPSHHLDHEDNNPSNNRLINLRDATPRQNCHNRVLRSDNRASLKGVSKHASGWRARIWTGRKNTSLGVFPSPQKAAAAYDEAAIRLHGAYAKTNKALGLI